MIRNSLRVVLEPCCLFLFDEGFGVQSMTRTLDWNLVRCGFDEGGLGLRWYKCGKTMGGNHGWLNVM